MEQAFMITTSVMLTFLFFLVGGIVGWIAYRTYLESRPSYVHPEFMDEYGNILPDEILAVRFENDYDDINDEDEEDYN